MADGDWKGARPATWCLAAGGPAARLIHLNNAGAALPPDPVVDRMVSHLRREAEIGGYGRFLGNCGRALTPGGGT